jgi:hypothetical protein
MMTNRTTKHFSHGFGPVRGHTPGLSVGARRPGAATFRPRILRQGVWDRALDGSAPKVAPIHHLDVQLLDIVARLGFSLFITTGFAAGLCLYSGMTLANPNFVRACGGVFLWTLALISCVTSRGS